MQRRQKGRRLECINLRVVKGATSETLKTDIENFRRKGDAWLKERAKP
jgi:hypothetical protein